MIIWCAQLKAISELSEERAIQTIELVALPLRVRCTLSYSDGTWKTVDINDDGEIRNL